MRVLLTDGSSLAARQIASALSYSGHEVEAVDPNALSLAKMTCHVRRLHRVPPYASNPAGWLEAVCCLLDSGRYGVLYPTQEQTALLAKVAGEVRERGVGLAVPPFTALERLQDKVSARAALSELDVPQPPSTVVHTAEELLSARIELPAFVKLAIGTASGGVYRVAERAALEELASRLSTEDAFANGVLVQQPVAGPLMMIQAVYAQGALVAYHCCARRREGVSGGASNKESVSLPELAEPLSRLGAGLGWHGALSFDAILGDDGLMLIDVNPRLVEPLNALFSGLDLVDLLLRLSARTTEQGAAPLVPRTSRPGVHTHQLLLALTGAAQAGRGRAGVLTELWCGAIHCGAYRNSAEELTPLRGDILAPLPAAFVTIKLLVRPGAWKELAGDAVGGYSLSPWAWGQIRNLAPRP